MIYNIKQAVQRGAGHREEGHERGKVIERGVREGG